LVLALPASAHTPNWTARCVDGQMKVSVDLEQYQKGSDGKTNTVTLTDTPAGGSAITLVNAKSFNQSFTASFDANSNPATGAADVTNVFSLTVKAWDDPTGSKGWTVSLTKTVEACATKTTTTTPPTTTTTTTTPPTTKTTPPATTTTGPTTSTTSVVVAATSTTPVGGGTLPFTGANVGLPLGIAGALVVIGGGLLFWLRFSARRKHSS
jgi:hypothetical protein